MQREGKPDQDKPLMKEHIESRRGWGQYVEAMTKVRRSIVSDADGFLADIRDRLDRALPRER